MIKPNKQGTSRHTINQLLFSSIDCRVQRIKINYLVFEGIIELTKKLQCSTLQDEVTRLTSMRIILYVSWIREATTTENGQKGDLRCS